MSATPRPWRVVPPDFSTRDHYPYARILGPSDEFVAYPCQTDADAEVIVQRVNAFAALLAVAKAAEPFDRTDTRIWTDNDFFQYHETLSLRLAELETAHPDWREWSDGD